MYLYLSGIVIEGIRFSSRKSLKVETYEGKVPSEALAAVSLQAKILISASNIWEGRGPDGLGACCWEICRAEGEVWLLLAVYCSE